MKPPPFAYHAPTSVADVLRLLQEHQDEDVRVIAGGQSLVPVMNFRLARPGVLVDLRRVSALAGIDQTPEGLFIGAMVRQSTAEDSPEVAAFAPLVAEALAHVAHRTIRHSGTVGGSLAHADPSAELPAVAMALRAELVLEGPAGGRTVSVDEFFDGPFTTVIGPDEILVGMRVPHRWQGQAFTEFARTSGSFALAGVATCVDLDRGRVQGASVALSGVAPTPVRAVAAEAALLGQEVTAELIVQAARAAVQDLSPSPDLHASTAARLTIARTCARRSIEMALQRATEGT